MPFLNIDNMLESNPLKSRFLVCGLTEVQEYVQSGLRQGGWLKSLDSEREGPVSGKPRLVLVSV